MLLLHNPRLEHLALVPGREGRTVPRVIPLLGIPRVPAEHVIKCAIEVL